MTDFMRKFKLLSPSQITYGESRDVSHALDSSDAYVFSLPEDDLVSSIRHLRNVRNVLEIFM